MCSHSILNNIHTLIPNCCLSSPDLEFSMGQRLKYGSSSKHKKHHPMSGTDNTLAGRALVFSEPVEQNKKHHPDITLTTAKSCQLNWQSPSCGSVKSELTSDVWEPPRIFEEHLGTPFPKTSNKSQQTLGKAFFFDENLGTKNNVVSTNVRKRNRDPTSSPELC